MIKDKSIIDVIKYYVIVSSSINISVLLFIKDTIKQYISHETVDFIITVFLVNICVILVVSYIYEAGERERRFRKKIKRTISHNNKYNKSGV